MLGKEPEMNSVLRVTTRYGAPPRRVFDAWIDPATAGTWLFATAFRPMTRVQIDARVGGSFRLIDERDGEVTEYAGGYVEISPHRRLVFSLLLPDKTRPSSRVIVEIAPLQTGSRLALFHENVPANMASYMKARWTGILYGLGVTLDLGKVYPEKFNETHCRFQISPIDYRVGPPRSTTIGREP